MAATTPRCGDIVTVGSANADVVLTVGRLPLPGETLAGTGLETCAGGKGANQAAAAARLLRTTTGEQHPQQQRSRLVALLGDDPNGRTLRSALADDAGVDLSLCRTLEDGTPTGTALILLLPSGENSIVIVGGANQSDAGWEAVLGGGKGGGASAAFEPTTAAAQLLSGGGGAASASSPGSISALLLQREVPDWVNTRAAELARGGGGAAAVVLDAGGAEGPLPAELLSHVTVLSPNETELARLAVDFEDIAPPPESSSSAAAEAADGATLPAETREWVERAARALLARLVALAPPEDARPRAVLVKLGSAGSALFSSSSSTAAAKWQPALVPEGPVIDTTGAGDCFTAAFAVARFAEGKDEAEALRFASAASCLCVQRRGAQPSMPRREEVEAFLVRAGGGGGGAS